MASERDRYERSRAHASSIIPQKQAFSAIPVLRGSLLLFMLHALLLLTGAAFAQTDSCERSWCNTFPLGDVKAKPPFGSSAWNKLVYVPDDVRFFIYSSDGVFTFSNSWWSYGVLDHVGTTNPWV